MVDVVDSHVRSQMMSGIRAKNTRPEILIRSLLHRAGYRFRIHVNNLPGKPDIVLPKYQAVIFTHGCFWHGHSCHLFKWPSTRHSFWLNKIKRNQTKDSESEEFLLEQDWRILRIWECAIKGKTRLSPESLFERVSAFLVSKRKVVNIAGTPCEKAT